MLKSIYDTIDHQKADFQISVLCTTHATLNVEGTSKCCAAKISRVTQASALRLKTNVSQVYSGYTAALER